MEKLSAQELNQALKKLKGWSIEGEALRRRWEFRDFREAMQFINRIAEIADRHDHHPELFNVYNQVELRYTTHDAGGITRRDIEVAAAIDNIQIT